MPEIKHSFTGGKMNKDLDERLVANGQYTHAMNVQVSTSEGSDVGTIQNLLGNHKHFQNDTIIPDNRVCIGSIADEKNDALYWFVASTQGVLPNFIMQNATQIGISYSSLASQQSQIQSIDITLPNELYPAAEIFGDDDDDTDIIPGCMDPSALNYNPNANIDDGSCIYQGVPTDNGGPGPIDDVLIPGCTDPFSNNYNALANYDDGSCTYGPDDDDDDDDNGNGGTTPGPTTGYTNGYFVMETTGGSILEYKNDIITPVVIDKGELTISVVNYVDYGGGLVDIQVGLNDIGALSPGLLLQSMVTLDPTYTPGQPGTVLSGTDFSTNPPQITAVNTYTGTFQLNFIPAALAVALDAGAIIGLTFVSGDTSKPALNFKADPITGEFTTITGINIIDDMLFWTDNYNEPKKINIPRCILGTQLGSYTRLINEERNITYATNIALSEEHVTVIKKAPSSAPVLNPKTGREIQINQNAIIPEVYTVAINTTLDPGTYSQTDDIITTDSPFNSTPYDFSGVTIGDIITLRIDEDIFGRDEFRLLWPASPNWNQTVVLKEFSVDNTDAPPIPITDYRIKGKVVDGSATPGSTGWNVITPGITWTIDVEITSIVGTPPLPDASIGELKYALDLFDTSEKLFEFKFPRFATRYKYKDGEYSSFSPFSEIAFIPGSFDYHPRKGYNIGMTNRMSLLEIKNFRLNDIPLDVVEIDILYKEDTSPNVYVVDTIRPNDTTGYWDSDIYIINDETINAAVPPNQLLRPWDNVPRKALAQEVTGNRIVYGNYLQNFTLEYPTGTKYSPTFKHDILSQQHLLGWNVSNSGAIKSIKSLREYQIGVVFLDEYGRETPVISNPTGTLKVEKDLCGQANRLRVGLLNDDYPRNMKYYKFYIKETSGEYYNMAMDRYYDAEDGNIWLAFPSSDRNKVDIDTFLILKKAQLSNTAVTKQARYKILAIENEAPDWVKTKRVLLSEKKHISGTYDVFNGGLNEVPVKGTRTFELNYEQFAGTSASHLHEITDSTLYVSFGKIGTSQTSKRYRIVGITTDFGDPTATAGTNISAADAKYYIRLEEELGSDVHFISNDPSGQQVTEIADNAKVKIWRYTVENSAKFDGRFFVKIFSDDVFKDNVQGVFDSSTIEYRVTDSKTIYFMNEEGDVSTPFTHAMTHSMDTTGHGDEAYVNDTGTAYNSNITPSAYSTTFGRYACYFRRYDYGNGDFTDEYSKYRFNSPSTNINYSVSNYQFLTPDIANLNTFGTWYAEWQMYTSHMIFDSTANLPNAYLNTSGQNDKIADNDARDHEVWFIDAGSYRYKTTDENLNWYNVPSSNYDNLNLGQHSGLTSGSVVHPSSRWFFMHLTLGPILKNQAFDCHTNANSTGSVLMDMFLGSQVLTNGQAQNTNYQSGDDISFFKKLSPGSQWRWKEDPHGTEFIIGPNTETDGLLRYWGGVYSNGVGTGKNEYDPQLVSQIRDYTSGAALSPNFNQHWKILCKHENQTNSWIPISGGGVSLQDMGPINNGHKIQLTTVASGAVANNTVVSGTSAGIQDYYVVVSSIEGTDIGNNPSNGDIVRLREGFIITKYHNTDLNADPNGGSYAPYLIVRKIQKISNAEYRVYLTGYLEALDVTHCFDPGTEKVLVFQQPTMNGYSPNSAARISINKGAGGAGAYTATTAGATAPGTHKELLKAVGYTMEFIEPFEDEKGIPENPAIWETEPKDTPELDVYYEASGLIPIKLDNETLRTVIPTVSSYSNFIDDGTSTYSLIESGQQADFVIPNGTVILNVTGNIIKISNNVSNWNTANIDVGSIVHITRPDGSIISTQVLNFIAPNYLTIAPITYNNWHTLNWHNCYSFLNGVESDRIRDNFNLPFISNGVKVSTTLDEEYEEERRKNGLIYSGIYNSITGMNSLNQFIQAEKITKDVNPVYGSIQKLHSRDTDLVTLCEDKVLKILANKDALYNADGNTNLTATDNVLGQTIPFIGEYGISKNPESFASESYRAYFTDKVRGAVLRLSKDGLTPISNHGMKDWFRDHLRLSNTLIGSYDDRQDEYNISLKESGYIVSFKEDVRGWVSFKSFVEMENGLSMANNYYTFYEGKIYQHHHDQSLFNEFYGRTVESSVTLLLNEDPGNVKDYYALSYEGSQARVSVPVDSTFQPVNDGQYYNLTSKRGWYLSNIITDLEEGNPIEFIGKEGKWFNHLKGLCPEGVPQDEGSFSYQGLGVVFDDQITTI